MANVNRPAAADIPMGPLGADEIPDNAWGQYLHWNLNHLKCANWTEDDYRLIGTYYYGLITQIDDVVATHGTPLYLYSRRSIVTRYRELDAAFGEVDRRIAYSVKDVIALAKAKPGTLNYSTAATGSCSASSSCCSAT